MVDINCVLEEYFHISINKIIINKCAKGDVNSSYVASCNGEKVFIKMQDKHNLPVLYRGQIEREASGLELCKKNGIPCPSILYCDFNNKYIITEYLEQPLLSQVWAFLSNNEKCQIKGWALEILRKMNSITSSKFGPIYCAVKEDYYDNWRSFYLHIMETAVNDCLSYGSIGLNESAVILDAAKENVLRLSDDGRAHFNHLDFHWDNIFVKKGNDYQLAGIIDFGSALYTPSYMDLFRLDGGFLYGTEKFYTEETKHYTIDMQQAFCADLFNTIDYFVFLSYSNRDYSTVKKRVLAICKDYLDATK